MDTEWTGWLERLVLIGAATGALRIMFTPIFRSAKKLVNRISEQDEKIEKIRVNQVAYEGEESDIHGTLVEIKERIGSNGDGRSLVQRIGDFEARSQVQYETVARAINEHALDDQAVFEAQAEWSEEATGVKMKLPKPRFKPLEAE